MAAQKKPAGAKAKAKKTSAKRKPAAKSKAKPAAKVKSKAPAKMRSRTQAKGGPTRSLRNSRLTLMDRVNRAKTIAEMRARIEPVAWGEIAKEVKLSVRQCQTIYADFLGWETVQKNPMGVVRETINLLTAIIIEGSETAADAKKGSSEKVGALKLVADQAVTRLAVMQAANLVPRHLGSLTATADVAEMLREFGELLEKHDVSDELLAELQALAEKRLVGPEQPAIEGTVSA